jgi:hypothetical protein
MNIKNLSLTSLLLISNDPRAEQIMLLNDQVMASLTAGSVSAVTEIDGYAYGNSYAHTQTQAIAWSGLTRGVWHSYSKLIGLSVSDGLAYNQGFSRALCDFYGIDVSVFALAIGETSSPSSLVWTKILDTRFAEISLAHILNPSSTDSNLQTGYQVILNGTKSTTHWRSSYEQIRLDGQLYDLSNVIVVTPKDNTNGMLPWMTMMVDRHQNNFFHF